MGRGDGEDDHVDRGDVDNSSSEYSLGIILRVIVMMLSSMITIVVIIIKKIIMVKMMTMATAMTMLMIRYPPFHGFGAHTYNWDCGSAFYDTSVKEV